MLRSLFILMFSFFYLSAQAIEEPQASNYIYKGLIEVGGGFNLSSNQNNMSLFINPKFGYLITDKISIGASIFYSSSSGANDSIGLSPLVKYYFYNRELLAGFVSQEIGLAWRGSAPTKQGITSVGAQYFLNNKVAFGVSLAHRYDLDTYQNHTSTTSLLGSFSIYY